MAREYIISTGFYFKKYYVGADLNFITPAII